MNRAIKLVYPFNDAACLEVEYRPGKWVRVTGNHFRSTVGNRRIGGVLYEGPVYYSGTNYIYNPKPEEPYRIVGVEELNTKLRNKKDPPQESRFYDRDARYR